MNFITNWLNKIKGTKQPEKKAVLITPSTFKNIIVAKVLKVEKHPNADRLRVVELSDGFNTIGPVVCGATNFDAGAIVALALPEAIIPHNQHDPEGKPFALTKAKIRGIESQGMICSGKELGISGDAAGILILKDNAELGSEFTGDLIKS